MNHGFVKVAIYFCMRLTPRFYDSFFAKSRMNFNRVTRFKQHIFAFQKSFHINRNTLVLADKNYFTGITAVNAIGSASIVKPGLTPVPRIATFALRAASSSRFARRRLWGAG